MFCVSGINTAPPEAGPGGVNEAHQPEIRDRIVKTIYREAEAIAARVVRQTGPHRDWEHKVDDILTSRLLGFPVMFLLLGLVFWITLVGASYPSQLLAKALFWGEERLSEIFVWLDAPSWLHGLVVTGVYRTAAWVVSVMLPPMAIFFPIFALLEDLGYLPRVAFNIDPLFKMAGTQGKQALTMSMGFGCNAAGVMACRIIESPRERLIAILTNNFVPCNGRFPTLIALASIFVGPAAAPGFSSLAASFTVAGLILAGILITLLTSWLLSRTILKGVPTTFTLELPPLRLPQVGRVLVRSVQDRTLFVLARAVTVAAPAGALIWVLANISFEGQSLLARGAGLLEPFGQALGLDGFILLAFILGLPANEIVLPILLMGYLSAGTMVEVDSLTVLQNILVHERGWTWLTALCTMLFSLLHFPCGTTLFTIQRETKSLKWMFWAAAIPLAVACLVCFAVAQTVRALGLV